MPINGKNGYLSENARCTFNKKTVPLSYILDCKDDYYYDVPQFICEREKITIIWRNIKSLNINSADYMIFPALMKIKGKKIKCNVFSVEGYFFEKEFVLDDQNVITIDIIDDNHPFFL